MAKTKRAKIDRQGAASAVYHLGEAVRALHALSISHVSGALTGEMVSICIDNMAPEMLRNVDKALAALDDATMGGFSKG